MNALDLIVLAAVVLGAVLGYRIGFLTRALSWIGLATGLAFGIAFLGDLLTALHGAHGETRLLAAIAFILGLSLLGQAIGLTAGALMRAHLPMGPVTRRIDRVAGAVVGGFGVLVALWLLIPALSSNPGWTARETRTSAIARAIDRIAPRPPQALENLAREVAEAGPQVFAQLNPTPRAGVPPVVGLTPTVDARVRASTVRVVGRACADIQYGSGVVAAPDYVLTNAHVVAGERRTAVDTPAGFELSARVVAFDPERDVAVLHVPGLGLDPLPFGTATVGTAGAVYGHPGGGPLVASPAAVVDEITALGTDIYRQGSTRRDVFVLAAALAPGDSGGALVDLEGRVVGLAFAIDPAHATTAYALTNAEVQPVLQPAIGAATPVSTGPCAAG